MYDLLCRHMPKNRPHVSRADLRKQLEVEFEVLIHEDYDTQGDVHPPTFEELQFVRAGLEAQEENDELKEVLASALLSALLKRMALED